MNSSSSNHFENSFINIFYKAPFWTTISILGLLWTLLTNSFLIYIIILRIKEKWDFCEYYYLIIDITDVINAVIIYPLYFTAYINNGYFVLDVIFCHIWLFLEYYTLVLTSLCYLILNIYFIYLMKWPRSYLHHDLRAHKRILNSVLVFSWIIWLPVYLIDLSSNRSNYMNNHCIYRPELGKLSNSFLGLLGFFLPITINIFLTFWTIILWIQSQKSSQLFHLVTLHIQKVNSISTYPKGNAFENFDFDSQTKSIQIFECVQNAMSNLPILINVNFIYFLTRIPYYIYFTSCLFDDSSLCSQTMVRDWTSLILFLNSVINPFIYLFMDRRIKEETIKVFHRLGHYFK